MRGVALVVAVSVVAEAGELRRFANVRQLMADLGLVPSEHSSGSTIGRRVIGKAANALARRVPIRRGGLDMRHDRPGQPQAARPSDKWHFDQVVLKIVGVSSGCGEPWTRPASARCPGPALTRQAGGQAAVGESS
jgi:hypothetical protein